MNVPRNYIHHSSLYHSSQVLYVAFPGISSVFIASYYLLLCVDYNSVLGLIPVGFLSLTFLQSVHGVNRPFQLRNYKVFSGKSGFGTLVDLHGKFP